jgi:hypothetical protein
MDPCFVQWIVGVFLDHFLDRRVWCYPVFYLFVFTIFFENKGWLVSVLCSVVWLVLHIPFSWFKLLNLDNVLQLVLGLGTTFLG